MINPNLNTLSLQKEGTEREGINKQSEKKPYNQEGGATDSKVPPNAQKLDENRLLTGYISVKFQNSETKMIRERELVTYGELGCRMA